MSDQKKPPQQLESERQSEESQKNAPNQKPTDSEIRRRNSRQSSRRQKS